MFLFSKMKLEKKLKIYLIFSVISVIILIIGLAIGGISGFLIGLNQGRIEVENKYQKKIEKLFPPEMEPDEVFSITGEIAMINDDVLVLTFLSSRYNPFEEQKMRAKVVRLASQTEIVRLTPKCLEELTAEERKIPSSIYREDKIDFSELKRGDRVTVEAESNIKNKVEFKAKKVILIPSFLIQGNFAPNQ